MFIIGSRIIVLLYLKKNRKWFVNDIAQCILRHLVLVYCTWRAIVQGGFGKGGGGIYPIYDYDLLSDHIGTGVLQIIHARTHIHGGDLSLRQYDATSRSLRRSVGLSVGPSFRRPSVGPLVGRPSVGRSVSLSVHRFVGCRSVRWSVGCWSIGLSVGPSAVGRSVGRLVVGRSVVRSVGISSRVIVSGVNP